MSPGKGTKHRTFRGIPDDLWAEAQAIAAARGETVSDEVRAAIERYVKRNRHLLNEDPK